MDSATVSGMEICSALGHVAYIDFVQEGGDYDSRILMNPVANALEITSPTVAVSSELTAGGPFSVRGVLGATPATASVQMGVGASGDALIRVWGAEVANNTYIDFGNTSSSTPHARILANNGALQIIATSLSVLPSVALSNNLTLSSTLTWGGQTYVAPATGNAGNTYPTFATIKSDGVTELGRIIDFHVASGSTADNVVRLTATQGQLTCSGTLAATTLQVTGSVFVDTSIVATHGVFPGTIQANDFTCANPLITATIGATQAITTTSSTIRWSTAPVNRGDVFLLNPATGVITVELAGTYHVCADVYLSTSTNPQIAMEVRVNGTAQRRCWAACLSCYLVLERDDDITINCYHMTSGGSFNVATSPSHTWLQIYKVG
jgi:hypothetical protein